MNKDFYGALGKFLQTISSPNGGIAAWVIGVLLLILPDSFLGFGIHLRNWVENVILIMGVTLTLWGFIDAIGAEIFFVLIHSFREGMEKEKAKRPPRQSSEENQ